jgi:hypothetical protein
MSKESIIISWDWKASADEIAEKLNEAMESEGIEISFNPTSESDDNITLSLRRDGE